MGRTKTFDRDAAVETVMNEIWQKGYESCSVKSLSETLGLTRSSFYNAFGTREELFLEVLQLYFERSPDRALSDINGDNQVLRSMCEVFKSICYARAGDHRGCLAINSVIELVGNDEKVGGFLSGAVEKSIERFTCLLGLAAKNGELASDDINDKAMALQNLLIGINVLCKVVHEGDSLWRSTKSTLLGLDIYKSTFEL